MQTDMKEIEFRDVEDIRLIQEHVDKPSDSRRRVYWLTEQLYTTFQEKTQYVSSLLSAGLVSLFQIPRRSPRAVK